YDSCIVICAHPSAHRAALSATAAYLVRTHGAERDPFEWTPEFSRRARGFSVWAALASLGKSGVAQMIDSGCARAREFADKMRRHDGVEILNEVVLNQVLVRVAPPEGGDDNAVDAFTRAVVTRAQASGELWLSG